MQAPQERQSGKMAIPMPALFFVFDIYMKRIMTFWLRNAMEAI